ncbi:MAG TPA: hypothetical protein VIY96_08680, partial [Thermoanaerobaculia bacterium]
MIRRLRAPLAGALLATPLLLFLYGRLALPSSARGDSTPPPALSRAFAAAVAELSRRAAEFQSQPEVVRSLEGGGIAVNRLALFTAAGHALSGAPPGAGLALTDPSGSVHAWWGEAPSLEGLVFTREGLAVRWSATRLAVVQRRRVGDGGFSGLVYSSQIFPIEAPDFARTLGLSGASAAWRPLAKGGPPLLTDSSGGVLVALRRTGTPDFGLPRDVAFAALSAIALLLAGRLSDPVRLGLALVLAFLAIEARFGVAAPLPTWMAAGLALGWATLPAALPRLAGRERPTRTRLPVVLAGVFLFAVALFVATSLTTPELGAGLRRTLLALPRVAGLAALSLSALSLAAVRRAGPNRGRAWTTAAGGFTTAAIAV